jgi:hypothetical protein
MSFTTENSTNPYLFWIGFKSLRVVTAEPLRSALRKSIFCGSLAMNCVGRLRTFYAMAYTRCECASDARSIGCCIFFHGQKAVVLAHGLTKESAVPAKEIDRAIVRMQLFKQDPAGHTHRKESSDG